LAFDDPAVALQFGNEEDTVGVGESVDIDGVFEFCWEGVEREYLPLGE